MTDFTWAADHGSSREVDEQLTEAKFGDGYRQLAPAGLNAQDDTFPLTFTREVAEADAIWNFLEAHKGGVPFTFLVPRTTTEITVIYRKKTRTWSSPGWDKVSVTFERWWS